VSTGPGQTALTRTPWRATSPAAVLVRPMTAVLGGDIGRHARGRDQSGDRGGVHHRARFLLQQHRQDVPEAEEHALDVDADDLVEHRLVVIGGMGEAALDPGIVEKAVDLAVGRQRLLDVVGDIGGFGDVGGDELASPPCCLTIPAVASPAAASRSTTAIFAPALAKASAAARPMPPPPPVISATLPVKSIASSLLCRTGRTAQIVEQRQQRVYAGKI